MSSVCKFTQPYTSSSLCQGGEVLLFLAQEEFEMSAGELFEMVFNAVFCCDWEVAADLMQQIEEDGDFDEFKADQFMENWRKAKNLSFEVANYHRFTSTMLVIVNELTIWMRDSDDRYITRYVVSWENEYIFVRQD